ncbi:MAG TPA: isocitrate lyase/phosphoenolpyruvate mutase family protein, partial [Thermoleophilaceae bacterium]|nr:isocitrate lyase/phosphoenolpyruvate mutase family protein [Thermoleophilaceae bacterium]
MSDLTEKAAKLRDLHRPGEPLVLANAWDAASARAVEAAGFPAVATTSAGVAEALGYEDHQDTPPDEMLAAVARIARAVGVPVTADLEGGYGLPAGELVERMLEAGAVGLNFEDTDHEAGGSTLVDAERQAERIRELRAAGQDAGVEIVINARVDPYVRRMAGALDESLRRSRLYLEAGADCVFPILAKEETDIARLVSEIGGPVNVLFIPGVPDL